MQATPVAGQPSGSQQPGSPTPNGPEPKKLPQPTHEDYSKPTPLLPNPFARYIPRDVPPPLFTNAPKIEQLIQNGKLMLSLNDAIAIALADNLDIAVARYNLPIADTDILRTKAGNSFLGVNSGVVHNTPGGGRRNWRRGQRRRRRRHNSRRWRRGCGRWRFCRNHQRRRPSA